MLATLKSSHTPAFVIEAMNGVRAPKGRLLRSGARFALVVAASCVLGMWLVSEGLAADGEADVIRLAVPSWTAVQAIGPRLGAVYDFQPFEPGMSNHLWMKASEAYATFLHFHKSVAEHDAKLIFMGDAIKGRFCAEDQPEQGHTGFVHFHRLSTPEGAMSHGGEPGEDGWWLRHVAVRHTTVMNTSIAPGLTMQFKPTKAPRCLSTTHDTLLPSGE